MMYIFKLPLKLSGYMNDEKRSFPLLGCNFRPELIFHLERHVLVLKFQVHCQCEVCAHYRNFIMPQ